MRSKLRKRMGGPVICSRSWKICSTAKIKARMTTLPPFLRRSCELRLCVVREGISSNGPSPSSRLRAAVVLAILPSLQTRGAHLPPVSPWRAAGGTLVNGPLRQRQPRRDIGENHAHAGADAHLLDLALRREHAVRPRQVADYTKSFVPGWLAALCI